MRLFAGLLFSITPQEESGVTGDDERVNPTVSTAPPTTRLSVLNHEQSPVVAKTRPA